MRSTDTGCRSSPPRTRPLRLRRGRVAPVRRRARSSPRAPCAGQSRETGGLMELRSKSIRGGAYLTVREGLGMLIRITGVFVITRVLGPADFGIYAGALAIVNFLAWAAQMGVEIEIIRGEEEPHRHDY